MNKVYLGLGSNLGEKEKNLVDACKLIEKGIGPILAISSYYYSKPLGFKSDNDFVNIVIHLETKLKALELLDELKKIEFNLGRCKKSLNLNYEDRIIDIDILLFNKDKIKSKALEIPHPRMKERDFVMIPLNELLSKKC